MNTDTKKTLITESVGLFGAVAKDFWTRQLNMNEAEQRKEIEKELLKARAEAEAEVESKGSDQALSTEPEAVDQPTETTLPATAREPAPSLDVSIEALKANEDCSLCRDLLDAIRLADPDLQATALVEYGEFKAAMEGDRATEADIKRVLEESSALERILIDNLGVEELNNETEGSHV